MPRKKDEIVPRLRVRKGATLKEIYAKARKAFTADDLQRFTEIGPMVPGEQLLSELKEIHREELKKKKKKK